MEDYVLSPQHREGRHRARLFESVLGVNLTNRDVLREAILRAAAASDDVEDHRDNGHGTAYSLRFPMRTPKGAATVVTADGALEVESADRDGRTYALVSVSRDNLMLLRDAPDHAVA